MSDQNPKIVCFSCDFGWGYLNQTPIPIEYLIPVTCCAKIESYHILQAFEKEADGVLILACQEGYCHFEDGDFRIRKMVYLIQKVLLSYGIETERIKMVSKRNPNGDDILNQYTCFMDELISLGPVKGK
ncbi:MAG: hydrogenase iron-sulfur subunit [Desulfobacterales bacterium]|nr:hydrogenase iron-sulfur subunit [Desulfobacterales bacterium]